MPEHALRIADVAVTYPNGTVALQSTRLDIAAGAFTVLLGPSGAGKSTLLRSMNGLVRPTQGQVLTAEGTPILRALRAHRARTGMVFQQHQLIGRLTALGNVLTGRLGYHSGLRSLLPLSRAEKRLALEALDRVGLLDRALHRADQLSGGQQQRVGIARALAQQPQLILADEPVASLDPATAARVLELLHGICKADGISAVVSLHQIDFARRFADRIIGLAGGCVVFDGPAHALDDDAIARIYGAAAIAPQAPEEIFA